MTSRLVRHPGVTVRDHAHADAVLTTRILSLGRTPLVTDRKELALEEGVTGRVEVTLTERSTGRVITTFVLARRAEGIRELGEDLDVTRTKWVREMADDIVVELEKVSFLPAKASGGGA